MNERLYSKKHLWVICNESIATIGITDFLQEKLGPIMFINLPRIGDTIYEGETFGDIESKKTVMDMKSPVSGEVICVNEVIEDEPDRINDLPYDSWLIKVKIDSLSDELLKETEYKVRIEAPWMQNH